MECLAGWRKPHFIEGGFLGPTSGLINWIRHQIRSVCDEPIDGYAGSSGCGEEDILSRWSEAYLHQEQWWQHCEATNYVQSMMILAMAMGHTVGRPVMGMGGGTINPMERLSQLPSEPPLDRKVKNSKSALHWWVRIWSLITNKNRGVRMEKDRILHSEG